MGYNTALMVCNDGLSQLERDADAGKKIARGVLAAGQATVNYIAIGNHANPVSILPSQHADVDQLVIVGGNTIRHVHSFYRLIGCSSRPLEEDVLSALAEELGYTLRKKAWRKREDAERAPTPSNPDQSHDR